MKKIKSNDLMFVGTQLMFFVLYFTPIFSFHLNINIALQYSGLVFTMIGFLGIIVAILQLNKNLTPFPTPINSGTLIKTGLYKFVRHPIYSGIIIATIGLGLYTESLWKISVGLSLWILFYFKSRYEENLLLKHYSDYKSYRINTGRFFPFI